MATNSVGQIDGIDYRRQPLGEVVYMTVRRKQMVYVPYRDGVPTGDHFRTLADLRAAIAAGHFRR